MFSWKSYFHIGNILECLKICGGQIERHVHWPLVSGRVEWKYNIFPLSMAESVVISIWSKCETEGGGRAAPPGARGLVGGGGQLHQDPVDSWVGTVVGFLVLFLLPICQTQSWSIWQKIPIKLQFLLLQVFFLYRQLPNNNVETYY